MISIVLLLGIFAAASCEQAKSRLVNLVQGPVLGYRQPDEDIYIFYNIPYAKAPTGSQRFKAPLPPPEWKDPYEAVNKEIICPQANSTGFIHKSKRVQEQEDCLVASIYVPNTDRKNIPVVVYVHGGAFVLGWGDHAVPKSLVKSKQIIAVTFNYRLGAHGFLCLGTEDIPGNAGMKDQVALLRWVKKNIVRFGGNPDEVTIAGYSAGSASVDLLMLSKMADGLFKRIIPESGANIAAFSIQSDPIKNAKEYAMILNFDKYNNIDALQDFYKTISYEQLNSANVMNRKDSTFLLSPCVERNLGEETFLEENPVNILKSGNFKRVPMLYGFTNMEGLFRAPLFEQWKSLMNENFSKFLPADLKFQNEMEMKQVAEKVRRFYFGQKSVSDDTIVAFINYFTDVIFAYPVLRSVKFQVEAGNREIYLYEYSYFDDTTPIVPHTNLRGAAHCAQTFAVLDGMASVDENHTSKMREIWLNFIKTGLGASIIQPHRCHCGDSVDAYGHHGLSCSRSAARFSRHSTLNDIIRRSLATAHVPAVLEPIGLARSDGKRPDGMTLIPWRLGRSLVWDATCVDTLAASHIQATSSMVGAAATSAEQAKRRKYENLESSFIFEPFGVETLGPWGPRARALFKELSKRVNVSTGDPRAGSYLGQRISLAIQRGNAASILGTTPRCGGFEDVLDFSFLHRLL